MNHACSIEPTAAPTAASEVALAPLPEGPLAISTCGRLMIEHVEGAIRIAGGAALAPAATTAGVAILDGEVWAVIRDGAGHALLRFDDAGGAWGRLECSARSAARSGSRRRGAVPGPR